MASKNRLQLDFRASFQHWCAWRQYVIAPNSKTASKIELEALNQLLFWAIPL
jgi:hypothetical protein